jgi:hypothetical protein
LIAGHCKTTRKTGIRSWRSLRLDKDENREIFRTLLNNVNVLEKDENREIFRIFLNNVNGILIFSFLKNIRQRQK